MTITYHCSECGLEYPDGNNMCHPSAIVDSIVSHDTLDGIPQAHPTPAELDLSPEIAFSQLQHALRVYHKAASRPRKAQCWAYVSCLLWNARQDAVRAGAIKRGTDECVFVSDRYTDAESKRAFARTLEGFGHADVRV